VAGDPEHRVACLLDEPTRRRLWEELRRGAAPGAARQKVGLEETA
jgi:hypothetical protein